MKEGVTLLFSYICSSSEATSEASSKQLCPCLMLPTISESWLADWFTGTLCVVGRSIWVVPCICLVRVHISVRVKQKGIWTVSQWSEKDVSNYQFSKHYFAQFKHITCLSYPLEATPFALQPAKDTHTRREWVSEIKLCIATASCLQLTNHHHHHTSESCTCICRHTLFA